MKQILARTFIALTLIGTTFQAIATVITLDAIAAGRHGPSSTSTINDYSNSPLHAGFRTFDLSSVTGTITGAQLQLGSNPPGGVSGSVVVLRDVSTAAALLGIGSGSASIFSDLTTGSSYGTFIHSYGTTNLVTLNAAGISSLMASIGTDWSVGLETSVGESFGYGVYHSLQRLVITTTINAPEPGSFALICLGMACLYFSRLKQKLNPKPS